jgi:predicted transcriptional regulator
VSWPVTVRLDGVQLAWLDALADLHSCTRAAVLRESLRYFTARESVRIERTARYAAIQLAARAERWDPISDYLAGRQVNPP